MASIQQAVVKSISSGDTLIVKPLSRSSVNENEQRISLNYVTAPKLARPPTDAGANETSVDEPYAFETREYLRKKLVGREICYTVDFQIPQSNRLMCSIYLGKDKETGENIIESLLSEGLVELRQQTGARANDAKYQRLVLIDEQAKTNKRGRYSDEPSNNHIRNMKWTLDNPKQFVDAHKSSPPIDAIVEFIRDGNSVRCLLLPSYCLVTIQLTGIKCPMFKREGNSTNETNEPFADEAKQFVETRLLQRQVKVVLDGVNNQNLVGTVLHPNGNIALHLLKEGLAKCVDWNLTLLQQGLREQYRAAEKHAKDNRLRIWQNYVAQSRPTDNDNNAASATNGRSNDSSPKEYQVKNKSQVSSFFEKYFQAKVMEIVNGDALTIRDLRDNKVKKIYLSSVRAPRAADLQQKTDENASRQQIKRPLYEIPYLFEARELLRKRLIGKTVRVVTDYTQPASNDYPEKICCTVYAGTVNMGEALISKGLAKTIRHRQDDEQRSSRYGKTSFFLFIEIK
jgi:staphylococcal nuclease domain-containing protein 1